jgi:hypothetical protein
LSNFRCGLSVLGFDALITFHPELFRNVFETSQKITSDYIQDLFVPQFSPDQSNLTMHEESTMMLWISYLKHIASKESISTYVVYIYNCIAFSEGLPTLKMS